ncbi:unnamed protein product, partial [Ectocarpus sp. 4 AP-2014]
MCLICMSERHMFRPLVSGYMHWLSLFVLMPKYTWRTCRSTAVVIYLLCLYFMFPICTHEVVVSQEITTASDSLLFSHNLQQNADNDKLTPDLPPFPSY